MSQPDTHGNSPHVLGHRRYRGQGQGQASSDPTPAPQTALSQNQDQSPSRQKGCLVPAETAQNASSKRQSDPFYYDSQSILYWDDSTGVIHNIPSSPSTHCGKSQAKTIAGWYNPYADIVGGGPYAQVSAADDGAAIAEDRIYARKTPPKTQALSEFDYSGEQPMIKQNIGSRFKPLLGPIGVRSDKNAEISKKERWRRVVGKRDATQKLRQGATAMIKAAAATREERNKVELESLTSLDMIGFSGKKDGDLETRTTSWAFSHTLATSLSPKICKAGDSFGASHTSATSEDRKLSVADASMPLEAFGKKQEAGQVIECTPTLDRVRKLRAEEQAKALAILEGQLPETKIVNEDDPHLAGRLARHFIKTDMTRVPRDALTDEEHQEANSVGGLGLNLPAGNSASSSLYSSDEGDDLEKLAKAVAGLCPFQNLPSPSKLGSLRHYSAIPGGLDLVKIQEAKEQAEEPDSCGEAAVVQSTTAAEAEAKFAEAPSAVDTSAKRTHAAHSSGESIESLSSEDYDRLSGEQKREVEQNGVKRRWYKGFRKV
ncbi:hypothetical protein Ptr902_04352 [Pyrenophora tritici-repentis]|nr:hypothetical protein Ptr902_04352 [Pyrenophora tritici-repentis]